MSEFENIENIENIENFSDLTKKENVIKVKTKNEIILENIKHHTLNKLLDDAETLYNNSKIINSLSKSLVWIFFNKIYFVVWLFLYIVLNIFIMWLFGEKGLFYISLLNQIGLFIIVFILGKFLKDCLGNIISKKYIKHLEKDLF